MRLPERPERGDRAVAKAGSLRTIKLGRGENRIKIVIKY